MTATVLEVDDEAAMPLSTRVVRLRPAETDSTLDFAQPVPAPFDVATLVHAELVASRGAMPLWARTGKVLVRPTGKNLHGPSYG